MPPGAAYLARQPSTDAAADVLGAASSPAAGGGARAPRHCRRTDAAAIAATHDSGRLRLNGRAELAAIEALEAHVIDPSTSRARRRCWTRSAAPSHRRAPAPGAHAASRRRRRAAPRRQQARPGHRSRRDEHAAGDVARWASRQRGVRGRHRRRAADAGGSRERRGDFSMQPSLNLSRQCSRRSRTC